MEPEDDGGYLDLSCRFLSLPRLISSDSLKRNRSNHFEEHDAAERMSGACLLATSACSVQSEERGLEGQGFECVQNSYMSDKNTEQSGGE